MSEFSGEMEALLADEQELINSLDRISERLLRLRAQNVTRAQAERVGHLWDDITKGTQRVRSQLDDFGPIQPTDVRPIDPFYVDQQRDSLRGPTDVGGNVRDIDPF